MDQPLLAEHMCILISIPLQNAIQEKNKDERRFTILIW